MHDKNKVLACATLLLTLVAMAPAAAAEKDDWRFGSRFRIGDISFRVGYNDAPRHRGVYFRVREPIRHPFHRCTDFCFRDGRDHYHHPSCPLIGEYFRAHGYAVGQVLREHAPSPPRGRAPGAVYGSYSPQLPYVDVHYDVYEPRADFRRDRRGRGRGRGGAYGPGIPPGHLPPPGKCRIWYHDRPPGHQPPPVSCATAYRYAPPGTSIVHGGYR